MKLLEERYAPITSEIGFLKCDVNTATSAYLDWCRPIQSARGVRLKTRKVKGDFVSRISSLLPLTDTQRTRRLFLPTTGKWTAYLDNGWRGTDAFSAVSYLCQQIGCYGVRALSVTDTEKKEKSGWTGRPGGTMFELYAPKNDECSFLNIKRSICCSNDGHWVFEVGGDPLEFEDLDQYKTRRIRDRFTPEMLDRYLRYLGIRFFSPDFYEVPEPGYLFEKVGPHVKEMNSYTLEEAQRGQKDSPKVPPQTLQDFFAQRLGWFFNR